MASRPSERRRRLVGGAAILLLAFGFVGACVASAYLDTGSLDRWVARVVPPGATLVHAETVGRHHVIASKASAPASALRVTIVHPPHPMFGKRFWFGVVEHEGRTLVERSAGRGSPPGPSWPEVDAFEFSMPAGFDGEIRVRMEEFLFGPFGSNDSTSYGFNARWP